MEINDNEIPKRLYNEEWKKKDWHLVLLGYK
jgi:hypothetical protein